MYSSAHYIVNSIDTHNYNTIAIPNPLFLVYLYPICILESGHGMVLKSAIADKQGTKQRAEIPLFRLNNVKMKRSQQYSACNKDKNLTTIMI